MSNPLVELQRLGQSPWHDNISRGLLTSGQLKRMVAAGDVTGLTSNPTIFEQAIATGSDYDDDIRRLARKGKRPEAITDALTIADIQHAADVFKPVYRKTGGVDGYVSIEVTPTLAHDTAGTITEAQRIWKTVNRPNLMVKIPATAAGVPAIEECIADGLNINVTLIFSLQRYEEVMDAYVNGLHRRAAAGKAIDGIASVASFFVSRVDGAVDKQLDEKLGGAGPDQAAQLAPLKGKAAIANAKLAYAAFKRKFGGERFGALATHGARVQRPLWASTSTKNPSYPDVYYVEALVGPDTVDTMPPATIKAYKDHGKPECRIDRNLDEATAVLQRLEDAGISMDAVTARLEDEGVASFAKSFESLIAVVHAQREALLLSDLTMLTLGAHERSVDTALQRLDKADFVTRLWKKDPTLWKADDAAHQAEIAVRLGWIDVVDEMERAVPALTAFADEIRRAGFTRAVLCGMGGSSLAPEVLRRTFGVAKGHVDVAVLDSTDPAAVRRLEVWSHPATTLYVIASKSGGTTEPNVFFRYFWERVRASRGERAGENFVAITDPGTAMERRARDHGFRHVFLNRPEIGGRYSALSYFGMVPAALMGIDVATLLERARRMMVASGPTVAATQNPSIHLGAVLGALARRKRDKLTFVVSDKLDSFGYWTEQLIAESTGKEGTGIVPVEGEPLARPAAYGTDRVIAYVRLGSKQDAAVAALARAGHPVIAFHLKDPYDLGAEFMRWEIATAVAGFLLDIDPFDQPNVQESKDNTVRLLGAYTATGRLPDEGGARAVTAPDFATVLDRHLQRLRPGRYAAVTAYVDRTPVRERALLALRTILRDRFKVATTVGYGPRFLHSTGQLHKGGPNNGVFIQLTRTDPDDVAIPGERYGFSTLKAAQALGDYESLVARKRPVLRVGLGADADAGLATLLAALQPAKARPKRSPARKRATASTRKRATASTRKRATASARKPAAAPKKRTGTTARPKRARTTKTTSTRARPKARPRSTAARRVRRRR
jgi:transaldolase/glucose-6-phosphate isomerase